MLYLPSSNYSALEYNETIEQLYDIISVYNNGDKQCLLMGDLNSEIKGDKCSRCTLGRGQVLTNLLQNEGYTSVNLLSSCKGPCYTFDPLSDHSKTSFIDHILLETSVLHMVKSCKILDDNQNTSDHLPVLCEINTSVLDTCHKRELDREYLKWNSYTSSQISDLYTNELACALHAINQPVARHASHDQIDRYYTDIVNAMKLTAMRNIQRKKFSMKEKPFWSSTLKEHHNAMFLKRLDWINDGRPRDYFSESFNRYKHFKRIFRNALRKAELEWENNEIKNLEETSEIDKQAFWRLVRKRQSKGPAKTFSMKFNGNMCHTSEDICKGWASYFEDLYSPLKNPHFDEKFKKHTENKLRDLLSATRIFNAHTDSDISSEEVSESAQHLKLGKAGGDDNLTNEFLRYGGPELFKHLSILYSAILSAKYVPPKMKIGLMTTILKPGKKDKSSPDSYRGITLLPVIYKLFEKIMLVRMQSYLQSQSTFPDPLQCAYQKNLSSINTTFSIQETVNYCLERKSKVFLCLMDNVKAFDVVWHTGLFVRIYESGINGKLWRLIINAYTGIQNCILFNGIKSTTFNVLQSTRQGSLWGAFFYLIFINALIKDLRELGLGAHICNIFSGIHVQADDIALISTQVRHLQIMIDTVYQFSCLWRVLIHLGNSKMLAYGESYQSAKVYSEQRGWHVGEHRIAEVPSHKHCGVTLSVSSSTAQRTKEACRKGRGVMLSLCNSVFPGKQINPVTGVKLYQAITIPTTLFGCELWYSLSNTEYVMLERFQRFCAKKLQHFSRQTRSSICCSMLGLQSVESHIDACKLKFLRRLVTLPSYATSKQIFLHRLFQSRLTSICSGPSAEIDDLCRKYNLDGLDSFLKNGTFADKLPWKYIVRNSIHNRELQDYETATQENPDVLHFAQAHPDPLQVSVIWRIGNLFPHMLNNCYAAARLLASPHPYDGELLCEFCGYLAIDYQKHYLIDCCHTADERNIFWQLLTDHLEVEISAGLFNLPDEEFLPVLLGGPHRLLNDINTHIAFLKCAINYIAKVVSLINIIG